MLRVTRRVLHCWYRVYHILKYSLVSCAAARSAAVKMYVSASPLNWCIYPGAAARFSLFVLCSIIHAKEREFFLLQNYVFISPAGENFSFPANKLGFCSLSLPSANFNYHCVWEREFLPRVFNAEKLRFLFLESLPLAGYWLMREQNKKRVVKKSTTPPWPLSPPANVDKSEDRRIFQ